MEYDRKELDQLARLDPALAERYAARMTPAERVERVERETAGMDKLPITEHDKAALIALKNCSMGVYWNGAERFIRDMTAVAHSDKPEITDNQRRYLWKLVYRFRRQIGANSALVQEALRMAVERNADKLKEVE